MMKPLCGLAGIALVFLATGCSSYKEDLQTLCYPEKIPGYLEAPPDERQLLMGTHYTEHLKTEQGRALYDKMPDGELLRAEARAQGLASCPLADMLTPPEESMGEEDKKQLEKLCQLGGDSQWGALSPQERMKRMPGWVEENIQSPRVLMLLRLSKEEPLGEQSAFLHEAAMEAGIKDCPTFAPLKIKVDR